MTTHTTLPIRCVGERLLLHPERAVYWPARRTLFVADVHFGKEDSLARLGVAIPHGPSANSQKRLRTLVDEFAPERLCILGDFMHAAPQIGEPWLTDLSCFLDDYHALSVEVVAGNHDKRSGRGRVDSRIDWREGSVNEAPFVLQHEPGKSECGYVLSGHIHPVHRLGDGGRKRRSLRAPAFWFRDDHAVLPAFGDFTGGHVITLAKGDRVFMSGPDSVVAVPNHVVNQS